MHENLAFYRSTQPAAQEFLAEVGRRRSAFFAQVEALEAEFPGHQAVGHHFRGRWVTGLRGETSPGPGWRQDRSTGDWRPDRRTTAGKKLRTRLEEIRFSYPDVPGMPDSCEGSGLHFGGYERTGDVIWCTWAVPPEVVERQPEFDAAIWTRARPSEYHLALEAREAARAVEGD